MSKSKSKLSPKLKVKTPVPVLFKPVKADFKDLFKALAKGVGHTATGKWAERGGDAVEALSAIGLTPEPGELAFLLIRRSLTTAVFELVGDSASQLEGTAAADADALVDSLDLSIEAKDMSVDQKFLDRPGDLPIIDSFKRLLSDWLKRLGIEEPAADAIAERLPTYFVYALNQEWRRNSKSYGPLLEALNTPFTKAGDRECHSVAGCFFFRHYGQRISGDPTFVFTHKSFGEYLAARRVVRAVYFDVVIAGSVKHDPSN